MAPFHLELPVTKVEAHSLPTTAKTDGALVAALWQHLDGERVQPPAKRRKIDSSTDQDTEQQKTFVCIADIAISLIGRDDRLSKLPSSLPLLESPLPVRATLHDVESSGQGVKWRLTISGDGDQKAARVDVELPHDLGPDADFHLSNLNQVHSWRDSNNARRPIWCEMVLERLTDGSREGYTLRSKIHWKCETVPTKVHRPTCDKILEAYVVQAPRQPREQSSPQLFYHSVHVPPATTQIPDSVQHPIVEADLFPFQKRTVNWLLNREGVELQEDGSVRPVEGFQNETPLSFSNVQDAYGHPCIASPLLCRITRNRDDARMLNDYLRGGILSEEMGLGKTVEVISLMALHMRTENLGKQYLDAYTGTTVTASRATLIITPPSILEQWKNEIAEHAPSLKVRVYENSQRSQPDIKETLLAQDVVLATYATISREIWHVDEKPKRNLRHDKKYEAPKSPLVEILWWRVCLDEAQMIESGVSSAAKVARRLPRCNAWAITGTPVRKDVQDLCGLLIFLRFEPFCEPEIWRRVLTEDLAMFKEIFGRIALRHTKAQIRGDLHLPPQKRITVTVPFTAIEEQHYLGLFKEMCEDVGLDLSGGPLTDDWDPDDTSTIDKMRTWLARLRQTCLHPEIGGSNRRALGRRTGPLRTVEEVLEVMIEQNETSLRSEERGAISAKLVQGHLHAFSKNGDRAVELYLECLEASNVGVDACRQQLEEGERRQKDGKLSPAKVEDVEESSEDESSEKKDGLYAYRSRLRSALEVQHASNFFAATAYFQVKSGHEEGSEKFKELETKEADFYERAKAIRAEILSESVKKTRRIIGRIKERQSRKTKPLPISHEPGPGGIASRRMLNEFEDVKDLINDQADVLADWRSKLTDLLTLSLLDQEEGVELSGEEYDETLKQQDESYAYLFLLRAVLTDRHEMITGQANYLVQHEIKEALKAAKEDQGHAPELIREGLKVRAMVRTDADKPLSLRAVVAEMRTLIPDQDQVARSGEELMIEREYGLVSKVLNEQAKDVASMNKELDLFRAAMNQRLDYYRQLQAVSDTVKPYAEETTDEIDQAKLDNEMKKEDRCKDRLAELRTKDRFLHHLRLSKEEDRPPCIICQSPFETGVLTVCGHEFCKDCLAVWMASHKTCPMCKRSLNASRELHAITYKPKALQAEEEPALRLATDATAAASKPTDSIYTSVSRATLDEIQAIDLPRSWGTKMDTLARHVLQLRAADPGAKSIIFSQYRDFLSVLARALRACKIGFADIADKHGIRTFRDDPAAETFLLHARADSSGLNLVNATHVFLAEPLVNTAIELQAVARVHRIGQRRPTTVWMYVVKDTVEESVYEMSVARRLAHVDNNNPSTEGDEAERGLVAADSAALQAAPLQKLLDRGGAGGELVRQDDLWRCLFARRAGRVDDDGRKELDEAIGRELRAAAAHVRRDDP